MNQLQLFDSSGRLVPLEKEIASGGEGVIYTVPSQNDLVAKVYRKSLAPEKQAKLRVMVQGCDEPLKKIAAWPIATLHNAGRQVCGFLMPKVSGCEPIHNLYSPGYRKQHFPNMTWQFLIYIARNTAAAFEVVHKRGHIIGDVNPNLVFVDIKSSIVRLIDCDSFHIRVNGSCYPCEVGVPNFLAPELHGFSNLSGIPRSKNHDNFGLALLIFHLLMMGRHPFSGVFSGNGDMPLEKSIEQFRYAFGRNAVEKKMAPPPRSVTPSILPDKIVQLFERAFTEQGVQLEGRPSARDWLVALDSIKQELLTCNHQAIHKYHSGLSSCPWCHQEHKFGNLFFTYIVAATAAASNFNLMQAWSQILAIQPPNSAPQINPSHFRVTPKPLPPELTGFFSFFKFSKRALARESLQKILNAATDKLNKIQQQLAIEAGCSAFQVKLNELSNLREKYKNLADQHRKDKLRLKDDARNEQLNKFFNSFFIKDHYIPAVGIGRKAVLASFGIETAADIDHNRIINIKGFGQKITADLVDWRKTQERKFIFDPSKGIDAATLAALDQRLMQTKTQIEKMLLSGPAHLNQIKAKILQRRNELLPLVQEAARQVAQAQADLDAFK